MTRRKPVYYRNSDYEGQPHYAIEPGFRTIYSLQLCNNEHMVKALLPSMKERDPIFSIGYGPQKVGITYPDNYLKRPDRPEYNLRYDKALDESITRDVYVNDANRTTSIVNAKPAVNTVMGRQGEAISMSADNHKYTKWNETLQKFEVIDVT